MFEDDRDRTACRHTINGVTSNAREERRLADRLHAAVDERLPTGRPLDRFGGCRVEHFTDRHFLAAEEWFERIWRRSPTPTFGFAWYRTPSSTALSLPDTRSRR